MDVSNTTCEILLNGSYDRFNISEKALNEYNTKIKEIDPTKVIKYSNLCSRERMNPILIDIVKKLGNKADGQYSKIYIESFNAELKDYIKIHDYDGQESIYADISQYKTDKIKEIVNSDFTDSDKITKIKEIIERKINL